MNHTWRIVSSATTLALPVLWLGMYSGQADAQNQPVLVNPVGPDQPTVVGPTTAPAIDFSDLVPLAQPYEKLSEGISFRPPTDAKLVTQPSSEYLAQWTDVGRGWTLKLAKMIVEPGTPLVTDDNYGNPVEGILNKTVKNLQKSLPGSKILRNDVTNTQDSFFSDPKHPESRANVGLIALRYTVDGKHRLTQQAIIRTTTGLYYLLTFTTPGANADAANAAPDPHEALAADVFG